MKKAALMSDLRWVIERRLGNQEENEELFRKLQSWPPEKPCRLVFERRRTPSGTHNMSPVGLTDEAPDRTSDWKVLELPRGLGFIRIYAADVVSARRLISEPLGQP